MPRSASTVTSPCSGAHAPPPAGWGRSGRAAARDATPRVLPRAEPGRISVLGTVCGPPPPPGPGRGRTYVAAGAAAGKPGETSASLSPGPGRGRTWSSHADEQRERSGRCRTSRPPLPGLLICFALVSQGLPCRPRLGLNTQPPSGGRACARHVAMTGGRARPVARPGRRTFATLPPARHAGYPLCVLPPKL